MTGADGPKWICEFTGKPSTYASGSRPSEAAAECIESGLGTPASITYAGYTASPEPDPALRPIHVPPIAPEPTKRSNRRAELVLTLYGLLRCDFPIGSILKPVEAAARLPSSSALRDFLANVGTAIQGLTSDPRIVDTVIENQGKAWISAARETNSRRLGKWKAAEIYAERKIRYRQHAKRLRKRVGYHKAIGELANSLDGLLPKHETAAENFRDVLLDAGLGADDVDSLVNRYRRINAPKL